MDNNQNSTESEERVQKESGFYKFVKGKGVMNLPNKLTISRVVMIPLFVLFFYLNFKGHYFCALAVFAIASFTDFLDGYLARKYNLVTNLGKFLDPVADKVLVASAMIIMLTQPYFFTAYLDGWAMIAAGCCVALILARELIVSGFRMVAADARVVIAADKIGKVKTVCQDLSMVFLLIFASFAEFFTGDAIKALNYIGLIFLALATILTVVSGVNYLVKNRHVLNQ